MYVDKNTVLVIQGRIPSKQIAQIMCCRGLFVSVSVLNTLHPFNNYLLIVFTRLETGGRDGALGRGWNILS